MPSSVEFDEFVRDRSPRLMRLAYTFTRDHALAEDLLQTALARTWPAWKRIEGDPEPYVRRTLLNTYNSWWRRRWTAERPVGELPDEHGPHPQGRVDDRDEIWRALNRLPRQQRSVLILRYFADLSEAEIADVLGVSPGSVKGYASKALAKLRLDPSLQPMPVPEPPQAPAGSERVTAVRERIRHRSRTKLLAAGTAGMVVLTLVAGLLLGSRLGKRPHPQPVHPSPSVSASTTTSGPTFVGGMKIITDIRDVPFARREATITWTPVAGKKYSILWHCAHDDEAYRYMLMLHMSINGKPSGISSCDFVGATHAMTLDGWRGYSGIRLDDANNAEFGIRPGVPVTVTMRLDAGQPGGALPAHGFYSLAVAEHVDFENYPLPTPPSALQPLQRQPLPDGRLRLDAGGPTQVSLPWDGLLSVCAQSQTPGILDVFVNGVEWPEARRTWWNYEVGQQCSGTLRWQPGAPEPPRGKGIVVTVRPRGLGGDWYAEVAGPSADWMIP